MILIRTYQNGHNVVVMALVTIDVDASFAYFTDYTLVKNNFYLRQTQNTYMRLVGVPVRSGDILVNSYKLCKR